LLTKSFCNFWILKIKPHPKEFMNINIDAHGLKIQGRGYGMFLPKFLGGSRVS
jgi:hypothetical protein